MLTAKEFCKLIEKDYYYFLYNKEESKFPYNCNTSANLVSSYLSVYFRERFTHRVRRNTRQFHGWTHCDSFCVDYTNFQFGLWKCKSVFEEKCEMSKEELFQIIQEIRNEKEELSLFQPDWYGEDLGDWVKLENEPLFGEEFARKIRKDPYSIQGFIEYLASAYDFVDEEVCQKCNHCL